MSFVSFYIRHTWGKGDRKRDAGLTTPEDIKRFDDISYGANTKYQVLDVYRPKNAKGILPVIVNFHGGAWIYGDKELYQFYCMNLAQHGFAVVNASYRLAPEYKFPTAMEDMNEVLTWTLENAQMYGFDTNNMFAVGDSAGAHLLSLYCSAMGNPSYADNYKMKIPEKLEFRAICLNCGVYSLDGISLDDKQNRTLLKQFLPKKGSQEELEMITPLRHMTKHFPPSYVMTAPGDFLKDQAPLMDKKLEELGIEHIYKIYGTEENPLTHVFHCNMYLEEGKSCNDEECAFLHAHEMKN